MPRWATTSKKWEPHEVELVKSNFRSMSHAKMAEQLGRRWAQVKSFCKRHGLVDRDRWTQVELEAVHTLTLEGLTAAQIAARLPGRTMCMVHRQRHLLGLCRKLDVVGLDDLIHARHSEQWSDAEIAGEWNASHSENQIARETVGGHRRKLGIAANAATPRLRARVAAKTAEQVAAAGAASLAELKSQVIRDRIKQMGWPADLRWREAQILSLIWERGPMTKGELAEAVGDFRGKMALYSNDRGGSYLATLQRRGLLFVFKRAVNRGRGVGRGLDLYSLNPFTIERRKAADHAGTQRQEQRQDLEQAGRNSGESPGRLGDGASALAGRAARRDEQFGDAFGPD